MSDLIAIAYDDEYKAEEVRMTLIKLQKEHLIELEDAAVIVKNAEGKIKLNQAIDLTTAGAVSGGFWGLLIGTLFLSPLLGAAVGAAAGAASGALSDIGVDDKFMKSLGETLQPKTSALFVLVRKVTPDKVLEEIAPYGGTVLRTSLTKDEEAQLQEVLSTRGVSV
ncbi:DUF1269 domain-containing protein [Planktothrix agardhii]|jgi:uncharacterized membrane protein|uniref:Membrane protein of uknown function UCP014873 n=2 Tax=Planktothrix agardhii TaxID=1160 RepID=A0A073CEK9_PLAA1|nr:DUF1269 domain-containing protein [Planktothrix agardhii]MCF3609051.1 DUF1269 domain-containing protein [Planktothrix agardhii 1033]BBD53254.1 membrane protein of uknown function [Planktothrix agardhii NIES-204]KEI66744.1 hypothetical protein A19Y_1746 [Planktothrix agardhii NIVA-CYA 126/8]MBG0748688.1 DUF1269 domain-containing protein [Planktothrix agardhii KL2]MCB8753134.1 DUF1269 domain-containing protein [Planktothrix agardhii 1810]